MTETFGAPYADAYDPIYGDKDYQAECDLIEELSGKVSGSMGSVLDLGCGTGRHAVILAGRGWKVTGVDRSDEMLELARSRAAISTPGNVIFRLGDVRSVRIGERFDVVLLMFAVLGYQLSDADVSATLATAAEHLRPGGLVLFDVWNGPAVESIGPSSRSKTVEIGTKTIIRHASGMLDRVRHLCTVDYRVEWLEGGEFVKSAEERHTVRYFFEPEIQSMISAAGLELVASGAFPGFDRPIDASEWNALYVARAPVAPAS